ncbi:MAG: tail fiber protein [Deltaproteobacteria bacterium]|nr:tail fiber protein [Deltaproteobacteria bacterium]
MRIELEVSKATMARIIVIVAVTATTLALASPFGEVPHVVQAGTPVSASQMNENFQSLVDDIGVTHRALVPVGSIVAWHKGLTGVSTLPGGWLECNGQVVVDAESPLDGQTLPDLNGAGLFLRGGATSGQLQEDEVSVAGLSVDMTHEHTLSSSHVNANRDLGGNFSASANTGIPGYQSGSYQHALPLAGSDHSHTVGSYSGHHAVVGGGSETRPSNMSVVWIIRTR